MRRRRTPATRPAIPGTISSSLAFSSLVERQARRDPCRCLRQESLVGQGAQKIHDAIDFGLRQVRIRDVPVQIELHALWYGIAAALVVEIDGVTQVRERAIVRVG